MTPYLSGRGSPPPGFTLVHRPRHLGANPAIEDSDGYSTDSSLSSDFESFTLVGRQNPPLSSFGDAKRSSSPSTSDTRPMKSPKKSRAHSGPIAGLDVGPWDEDLLAAALSEKAGPAQVGSSRTPLREEAQSKSLEEKSGDSIKNMPTLDEIFMDDDDDSDSEWSVISEDGYPQGFTSDVKHDFYCAEALNDSTDTIVAVKDHREPECQENDTNLPSEGEDSEWNVPKAGKQSIMNAG